MGSDSAPPARRPGILRRNFSPVRIYLPARRPTPDDCDVALVQGFLTTPAALDPLRRHLQGLGLRCAIPRLGGLRGGYQTRRVAACAAALASWLADRPADAPPPWLVAHSLGGIIARAAVQRHGARVAGVVTLGTPHRGTPTAFLGLTLTPISRAPLDLLPLSRTLRRLNRGPWPADVPLLSISGGADIMCPPPFGRLPFSGPSIAIRHHRGMGHTEMLASPDVLGQVADMLSGRTVG